jgi:hypothetical protein
MRRKHTPGCPCCTEAQTCADLIAKTLYLTDVNGTHTLTFDTVGLVWWQCCYSVSGVAHTTLTASNCNDEVGAINVAYRFLCHTFSPAGGAALSDSPFLASFTIPAFAPPNFPNFTAPTPFQGTVTVSE